MAISPRNIRLRSSNSAALPSGLVASVRASPGASVRNAKPSTRRPAASVGVVGGVDLSTHLGGHGRVLPIQQDPVAQLQHLAGLALDEQHILTGGAVNGAHALAPRSPTAVRGMAPGTRLPSAFRSTPPLTAATIRAASGGSKFRRAPTITAGLRWAAASVRCSPGLPLSAVGAGRHSMRAHRQAVSRIWPCGSQPTPVTSICRPSSHRLRTVISFWVSVPVLSVQIHRGRARRSDGRQAFDQGVFLGDALHAHRQRERHGRQHSPRVRMPRSCPARR